MTRVRAVVALLLLVLLVGLLAGVSVADPFHLRQARWFTAGLVALALVLVTAALAVVARRGVLRGLVLVLGLIAVLGWGALVYGASTLTVDSKELKTVADGGRSLVILESTGVTVLPVYAVVVRSGSGPFEQESVLYQGPEGAPPPTDVRFTDGGAELLTAGGCRYSSAVEAGTLAVDPVHRPLLSSSC